MIFEQSEQDFTSFKFKSPSRMILSYLPNVLLRLTGFSSKIFLSQCFGDSKQKECFTFS